MSNYTILVTGGAGFVGSNLTESLLKRDYNVICIDDLSLGSEDNINEFKKNKRFQFLKCNIKNKNRTEKYLRNINFNYTIHCAATVGVRFTKENPDKVLRDIIGLANILDIAKNKRVIKFINFSSCEVYGDYKNRKFSEKSPIVINSLYACVKATGERLCDYYSKLYNFKVHNLRLFNVYGKKQRSNQYGFVVGKFIRNALKGKELLVYSDGQQTRDFTYIDDAVDIIIKLLERDDIQSKNINVGTGRQIKIIDLARKIIALSGSKSTMRFLAHKKDYISKRCADISLLNQLFNKPRLCQLDEGMKKTIRFYKNKNERINNRTCV